MTVIDRYWGYRSYQIVFLILSVLYSTQVFSSESDVDENSTSYESAVQAIHVKSFREKTQAINNLAAFNNPQTLVILQSFLTSKLFYRKTDKRVVITKEADDGVEIVDAVTSESYGVVEQQTVKKIRTNNKLRKYLRLTIAGLSLNNPDDAVRLNAIQEIMKDLSDDSLPILIGALKKESNPDIQEVLKTGVALIKVESDVQIEKLEAIATLASSLLPESRNRLNALLDKDADGKPVTEDKLVRTAATKALKSINTKIKYYDFIETVFFGLSLGSVLLLAAIGLAITFGVMGVINMAHGELIMIGAYTTYVVQLLMPDYIDYSLFVAVPAAFIVAGLFGILIERGVIRFLYGRPLETLLATFGISLILQQLVRTVFSPLNRSVETPSWMSGAWEINNALSLTFNRLYIIIFSLMVFFALLAVLKKTSLGLQVRAVSQNRSMAKALGVRSDWVDALTFGLGSGIAGVAGVALSQLTNVGPNLGQSYIIDSFMVVVFGGVGNLWGTLVSAMSLGVINKFLEPWSGAVLAKILVLVCIILFIQKRPKGMFPQKGRSAEN